jgi:RNA polymerase sigma-70 factor (ECF subfamily)
MGAGSGKGLFLRVRDADIIARRRSGDESAFADLYAAHGGRVKAYLLRSGFEPADADDLLQETFLRVFKSLDRFDPARGAFAPWLGAIARNVARRQWRKRRQPENFDPQLAEEMFASDENPSEQPQRQEAYDALEDCLAALDDQPANLIRLRYVDGLTTRGLAQQTNLPESTVRLRLAEARAALSRCLAAKGFLEG